MFTGTCIGNLTRDPELSYTASGTAIAKFGIAVRRTKEVTDFFDFTAFNQQAELISQHCKKGSKLAVVCRPQLDRWEREGQKHSKIQFIVDNFEFLGGSKPGDKEPDGEAEDNNKKAPF